MGCGGGGSGLSACPAMGGRVQGVMGLRVRYVSGTHTAGRKVLPKLGGNLEAGEGGRDQPSKVSIKLSC